MKDTLTQKTGVETSACSSNHNETGASGLRVRTAVKAGFHFVAVQSKSSNHNQTGIAVRTNVKAGLSLNFTKITYN